MPGRADKVLHDALTEHTTIAWQVDDGADHPEAKVILAWQPPTDLLRRCPNAELLISYGAGTDFVAGLKPDPDLKIARTITSGLQRAMASYVLADLLPRSRHFDAYQAAANQQQWQPESSHASYRVVCFGAGAMTQTLFPSLRNLGIQLTAVARSAKTLEDDTSVLAINDSDQLHKKLNHADAVINILPDHPATRGFFNQALFAQLKPGSHFLNVGRAAQVDHQALVEALKLGRPASATLDVLPQEPLPDEDPLWQTNAIRITPHIAALTDPIEVAQLIGSTIDAWQQGKPLPFSAQLTGQHCIS